MKTYTFLSIYVINAVKSGMQASKKTFSAQQIPTRIKIDIFSKIIIGPDNFSRFINSVDTSG